MRSIPTSGRRAWLLGLWISCGSWAYPALALAAGNIAELDSGSWVRPACVLTLVGAGLFGVWGLFLRCAIRAALAVAITAVCWFQFWNVVGTLQEWFLLLSPVPQTAMTLCLGPWAIGWVLIVALVLRARRLPQTMLTAVAVAVGALLAQPAWTLSRGSGSDRGRSDRRGVKVPEELRRASGGGASSKPDVYVIVLDAYGRDDALARYLGIDNRVFVDALSRRGFVVARHSQSNYNQTLLSLSSMMSMDYVQSLPIPAGSTDVIAAAPFIDGGKARTVFASHGLKIVNIPSATTITEMQTADWIVADPNPVSEALLSPLEALLVTRTPLVLIPRKQLDESQRHRNAIDSAFRYVGLVAKQPWPKFVFAHFLVPHPPFVFDANGGPVDSPTMVGALEDGADLRRHLSESEYRKRYAGQLAYTNRRVLETLDTIRQTATRPSILILMGDHGSRMHTDFRSLAKTDSGESSRILMAISLPEATQAERETIDRLSPVNVLRFVLSARFGEDFPLLPTRGWISPMSNAFVFEAVPDAAARLDTESR